MKIKALKNTRFRGKTLEKGKTIEVSGELEIKDATRLCLINHAEEVGKKTNKEENSK